MVTAMQVIPKAQGVEVISCSADDIAQQCVSVSIDDSIVSWSFVFLILLVAMIAFGFLLRRYLMVGRDKLVMYATLPRRQTVTMI